MEERRRSKRTEMSSTLMVKRLDQGDMQEVSIDIVDVSPNGVGFLCKEVLSIGAVYESKLRIWTQEVLHAFLQIVRIEMKEDTYAYGAVFIGMPESDAAKAIKATVNYYLYGQLPSGIDGVSEKVFQIMRADIDRNNAKYQEICKRNTENINKRWQRT